MGSEYQWWLVAVALAAAAGISWLLRGALPRREVDVRDDERAAEAAWISAQLREAGEDVSAEAIERALELHRTYLEAPPPPPPPASVEDARLAATNVEESASLEMPAAVASAPRSELPAAVTSGRRREQRAAFSGARQRGQRGSTTAPRRDERTADFGEPEVPPARYRESRSGG